MCYLAREGVSVRLHVRGVVLALVRDGEGRHVTFVHLGVRDVAAVRGPPKP